MCVSRRVSVEHVCAYGMVEGRKAGKENFIEINVKGGLVGCTIIR